MSVRSLISCSTLSVFVLAAVMICGCSEDTKTNAEAGNNDASAANQTSGESNSDNAKENDESKDESSKANAVKAEPLSGDQIPRPSEAGDPIYTAETDTMMFHQTGTVAKQAEFYTSELGKLGWQRQDSSEQEDDLAWLDFKKGDLSITITIQATNDKITTIAQGSGVVVPESLVEEDD